jgi:hypothetical protein
MSVGGVGGVVGVGVVHLQGKTRDKIRCLKKDERVGFDSRVEWRSLGLWGSLAALPGLACWLGLVPQHNQQ